LGKTRKPCGKNGNNRGNAVQEKWEKVVDGVGFEPTTYSLQYVSQYDAFSLHHTLPPAPQEKYRYKLIRWLVSAGIADRNSREHVSCMGPHMAVSGAMKTWFTPCCSDGKKV
jgi:hypothetical protein